MKLLNDLTQVVCLLNDLRGVGWFQIIDDEPVSSADNLTSPLENAVRNRSYLFDNACGSGQTSI